MLVLVKVTTLLFLINIQFLVNSEEEIFLRFFPNRTTINKNSKLIVLIHGWMSHWNKPWYSMLTKILLENNNNNNNNNVIIQIDWSIISNLPYLQAVRKIKYIGEILAKQLLSLTNDKHLQLKNIHLVGHSLGAHISGFVGKNIKKWTRHKIGRITGLDPAGPLFYRVSNDDRLNKNDADVVVVYHTDGGKFGYIFPLGHIDIFPNGGISPQPGCSYRDEELNFFCSHKSSSRYFIQSLETGYLIATKCANYFRYLVGFCTYNKKINLGSELDNDMEGKYYLKTI